MAKIALFVGSVRKDRHGIKVAKWMDNELIQRGHEVYFIDPMKLHPPLLDRMYKEMTNPPEKLKELGAPSISYLHCRFLGCRKHSIMMVS